MLVVGLFLSLYKLKLWKERVEQTNQQNELKFIQESLLPPIPRVKLSGAC